MEVNMIFADTLLDNLNSILVACLPYDFASTNTDLLRQHLNIDIS